MDIVADVYESMSKEIERILIGNEDIVERLFIAVATKGHVLLEGLSGIAKTTIAKSFANLADLEYSIQMMPDLLPSDVTGTDIYNRETGEFAFQEGPIFANLVLADEINRTTPKTQSALLEAMEEGHVTIGSETKLLPQPFMLIVTQNPIESEGTFQLPITQRDRFQFKLQIDLPDRELEHRLIKQVKRSPDLDAEDVSPVVSPDAIARVRRAVSEVYLDERIEDYILDLVAATRDHPDVTHNASPRASIVFPNGSKAKAAIERRDYVIPDDVKHLSKQVLAHRIVLNADAEFGGRSSRDIIEEVVADIEVPGSQIRSEESTEWKTMSNGGGSNAE